MKTYKIKYWLINIILLAGFLICGCAGGNQYERGSGGCDRGQYWSRTADSCVPLPAAVKSIPKKQNEIPF